jgi:hypothetical protein
VESCDTPLHALGPRPLLDRCGRVTLDLLWRGLHRRSDWRSNDAGKRPATPAKLNNRYSILGAAWGAPIRAIEVQIDTGSWVPASLDKTKGDVASARGYVWRFWTLDRGRPASGDHTVRSRAIDVDGNVQPAPADPVITTRRTYWEANGQITRQVRIP